MQILNKYNLPLYYESIAGSTAMMKMMKDIEQSINISNGETINLSVGNPLFVDKFDIMWRQCIQSVLDAPDFKQIMYRYGGSKGYEPLINEFKDLLSSRYGLKLDKSNIIITSGSQSLYFMVLNILTGYTNEGLLKKVLFPIVPEYVGYESLILHPETIQVVEPKIQKDSKSHVFQYDIDLDKIELDNSIGCIVISRPTNPSGNIIDTKSLEELINRAKKQDIPVMIDCAYGPPFPNLNCTPFELIYDDNVILTFSLSKVGLPGERVGIAVGNEKIIEKLACFQTNIAMHSSRFGQAIAYQAIKTGELELLSKFELQPLYFEKGKLVITQLNKQLSDKISWYTHKYDGGMFIWLWLEGLKISDTELYTILKQNGVIVVPGNPFFFTLKDNWAHAKECIRISLASDNENLIRGVEIITNTINNLYEEINL